MVTVILKVSIVHEGERRQSTSKEDKEKADMDNSEYRLWLVDSWSSAVILVIPCVEVTILYMLKCKDEDLLVRVNVAESKPLHSDKLVTNKIMGIANGAYIIAFFILVYSVTLVTRVSVKKKVKNVLDSKNSKL